MKLAFVGIGQMGRTVQKIAVERGHEIVGEITSDHEISERTLGNAELVIEASVPSACVENCRKIAILKKDLVVATTGWYENLPEVRKFVEKSGIRFLYSSNFSIGVNFYFQVIEFAAQLFNHVEEYDVWGTEIHQKSKVDSPSGTAKTIEKILLKNLERKTKVVEEKLDRKMADNELHFSSTRGGFVNFGHTVGFDSAADCIKIEHFARNRDGYAFGCIKTAEWLKEQKSGFYEMEDFLRETLFSAP
jgi:4-hydroxy-tetrahydrodipicolinate reductase